MRITVDRVDEYGQAEIRDGDTIGPTTYCPLWDCLFDPDDERPSSAVLVRACSAHDAAAVAACHLSSECGFDVGEGEIGASLYRAG